MRKIGSNIYSDGRRIYTLNLTPGKRVYGERLVKWKGKEYREWNPRRSKLAALIKKGYKGPLPKEGDVVLYLGAAQGTTPSHVSDIVGPQGLVICVEFSAKAFEKLLPLCEERQNMIPVFADANNPEEYADLVPGKVDVVYEDVAQKRQTEIGLKNVRMFLKEKGLFMIMVKARSIDVTRDPQTIFREEKKKIEKAGLEVVDVVRLDPFEKDHAAIIALKTG